MFEIDLSSLEPGVHHVTREVSPEALEPDPVEEAPSTDGDASEDGASGDEPPALTDDVTFGPVQVDAVVDYQPRQVLVTFQARTTATLTCDRTLRRFDEPLEGGYAVLFAEPGRGAPETSDDHDELRDLAPGARRLDLTQAVRDTLFLAVPQRKVAPGAEDEPLDTVHGAPETASGEEPVDPRWNKLRELRTGEADAG